MKRKITYIALLTIILAFTVLFITVCDDPFAGNEGTVTINFGGGGRSATSMPAWPGDDPETIALLDFIITLTGNGGTITREADGASGAIRIPSVPVGRWNVEVKAYYQGTLYATSLPVYVDVKAGHTNSVFVQMQKAYEDDVYYIVTFDPVDIYLEDIGKDVTITQTTSGGFTTFTASIPGFTDVDMEWVYFGLTIGSGNPAVIYTDDYSSGTVFTVIIKVDGKQYSKPYTFN